MTQTGASPPSIAALRKVHSPSSWLSTCSPVVDIIRDLLTNLRQFKELLLDEGVFSLFSQLSIFDCLFSQIIGVVKHATMLVVGTRFIRLNFGLLQLIWFGLLPIITGARPMPEGLRLLSA
jgi:hypothetical protein